MEVAFLIIPTFIAGILTFLAPCTFSLIPGYLIFISGVSAQELKHPKFLFKTKTKILFNGFFYILGFSIVFILLGSLFGLGGAALFQYRGVLRIIGGISVIFFGLFLLLPENPIFWFLRKGYRLSFFERLKPGNPVSSFLFGTIFASGWSPCVGPILGTALTLASSSATVGAGALLLAVFSLGLAIPFLLTALVVEKAILFFPRAEKYLRIFSFIGGLFLIFLGTLMSTNKMALWISWVYRVFDFIDYSSLIQYL